MYEIYFVMPNDTLEVIAQKHGTTVEELQKINGKQNLELIQSGMQIIVPVSKGKNAYRYYTVQKGDSLSKIARENGINYQLLLLINGLDENDYIYPNQTLLLPRDDMDFYYTLEDDTISSVLEKQGVSLEQLLKDNENIFLKEGQILVFQKK